MFPSTNNPNDTLFRTSSYAYHENPNSTQEEYPPFFSHFPSPFLDNHHLFFNQLPEQDANMGPTNDAIINTNAKFSTNDATNPTPLEVTPEKRSKPKMSKQRRTGKKDRHSKIYTAQGLRDRRMRLSLQIARKFFDLQDMLGFDKASKTIEWLFSKSKKAIKEVTLNNPKMKNTREKNESIVSECEVESTIENVNGERSERGKAQKVTQESRDKARARARERTREKMMIKSKLWYENNTYNTPQLRSSNPNNLDELGYYSSPLETGEESSSRSQEKNSPYEASSHSLSTQLGNVEIMQRYLGTTSLSMLDHQNIGGLDANFVGFPGNWEMENARINSSNYCGSMTSMTPLTGNFHGQNPSSLFVVDSNIHSHEQQEK
ncbi:hypothetical protein LguiA_000523 [Lonicera macranthoides]